MFLGAKRQKSQKGVVLILALLIVALVTTVVVAVSWRFGLSVARNENRWHGAQARLFLETAEEIAINALTQDMQLPETNQTDTSAEFWNQEVQLPIQEVDGWVGGRLEDANRRINLNLLLPKIVTKKVNGKDVQEKKLSAMQERFIRLLQLIELESGPIDPQMATDITYAIQDWIDTDSNVATYNSAERDYYESLDPPYPIANGPLTSVSDLLIIKGMTPELYKNILPYVFALPRSEADMASGTIAEEVKLNVNTMPPIMLRTFNAPGVLTPLPEEALQFFEPPLSEQGFMNVDEFKTAMEALVPPGGPEQALDVSDLTIKSSYFILKAETQVGGSEGQYRRGQSLLFRNNNGIQVLRRTESLF